MPPFCSPVASMMSDIDAPAKPCVLKRLAACRMMFSRVTSPLRTINSPFRATVRYPLLGTARQAARPPLEFQNPEPLPDEQQGGALHLAHAGLPAKARPDAAGARHARPTFADRPGPLLVGRGGESVEDVI